MAWSRQQWGERQRRIYPAVSLKQQSRGRQRRIWAAEATKQRSWEDNAESGQWRQALAGRRPGATSGSGEEERRKEGEVWLAGGLAPAAGVDGDGGGGGPKP